MGTVGSILRSERLRRGVELEQVSAETRISVKNLRAIEDDDLAIFKGSFFYKSFVRQFAAWLALPAEAVDAPLAAALSAIPEPPMPGVPENGARGRTPKVAALRSSRRWNLRWFSSAACLVLMLGGCSGLHVLWENSRGRFEASATAFIHSAGSRLRGLATATVVHAAPSVAIASARVPARVPVPSRAATTAPSQEASGAFHVEVSAVEPAWLSIVTDGKEIYSGTLEAAETKTLEGHDRARIRTGNAGALSVMFNGKVIGPLGERGQVRTVVFTPDNYEILGNATAVALVSFTPKGE